MSASAGYRWHFSRAEINAVLNFCHPIPVSRGLGPVYVAEHYPGLEFSELIRLFYAAGLRVPRGSGTPVCPDNVACLHFNNVSSFLVEYESSAPR